MENEKELDFRENIWNANQQNVQVVDSPKDRKTTGKLMYVRARVDFVTAPHGSRISNVFIDVTVLTWSRSRYGRGHDTDMVTRYWHGHGIRHGLFYASTKSALFSFTDVVRGRPQFINNTGIPIDSLSL